MGTPVLATTEKGLNNLVRDGINGYIINTRDPHDLADKMGRALTLPRGAIRSTVPAEFTLDHMVEKTLEVYRNRLDTGAAAR